MIDTDLDLVRGGCRVGHQYMQITNKTQTPKFNVKHYAKVLRWTHIETKLIIKAKNEFLGRSLIHRKFNKFEKKYKIRIGSPLALEEFTFRTNGQMGDSIF